MSDIEAIKARLAFTWRPFDGNYIIHDAGGGVHPATYHEREMIREVERLTRALAEVQHDRDAERVARRQAQRERDEALVEVERLRACAAEVHAQAGRYARAGMMNDADNLRLMLELYGAIPIGAELPDEMTNSPGKDGKEVAE